MNKEISLIFLRLLYQILVNNIQNISLCKYTVFQNKTFLTVYSIHLSIYLSLTWEGICLPVFDFFFLQWDFFVIFCLIHCYKLFLFLHLKQINFWYSKIITFLKYSFWNLKFFFFICAIHRKINCWYLQNIRSC